MSSIPSIHQDASAHFARSVVTLIIDCDFSSKYAASRIAGLSLGFCWKHFRRDFIKVYVA